MQINLGLIVISRLLCACRTDLLFGSHMVILHCVPTALLLLFPFRWEATRSAHKCVLKSHPTCSLTYGCVANSVFYQWLLDCSLENPCFLKWSKSLNINPRPLYESSVGLWAAVGILLCQAGCQTKAVSHLGCQEGREVVLCVLTWVSQLGTCRWQRPEHISLHVHFVGEVFGGGRPRAGLVSIRMCAAIWLFSKDERGIR